MYFLLTHWPQIFKFFEANSKCLLTLTRDSKLNNTLIHDHVKISLLKIWFDLNFMILLWLQRLHQIYWQKMWWTTFSSHLNSWTWGWKIRWKSNVSVRRRKNRNEKLTRMANFQKKLGNTVGKIKAAEAHDWFDASQFWKTFLLVTRHLKNMLSISW